MTAHEIYHNQPRPARIAPTIPENKRIALETLDRLNKALASDSNALVRARRDQGTPSPERAYIDTVREILALALEDGELYP